MDGIFQKLPPRPQSEAVRYAIATLLVAVCFILVLGMRDAGVLAFFVLIPAIFIAAVCCDRQAGLYATALSTALLLVLLREPGSLVPPRDLTVPIVAFAGVGTGLVFVSDALRRGWEEAAQANEAKDLVLREIGHRTKNNLMLAVAILSLQARGKVDPELKLALEKAVTRIHAIATAHNCFEADRHGGRIEMKTYLKQICDHLVETLRETPSVSVNIDAEELHLKTDHAISVGLIVNELVTNALKHAFPGGRNGAVSVTLRHGSPTTIVVEDNGIGCPEHRAEGFGSRLMRLFAKQLGGAIDWDSSGPGCRVRVVLRKERASTPA